MQYYLHICFAAVYWLQYCVQQEKQGRMNAIKIMSSILKKRNIRAYVEFKMREKLQLQIANN